MNDHDDRDPIEAAFDAYQRPPADIVPRCPVNDDHLDEIAGQTAPITYFDLADGGVAKHVERLEVTAPIREDPTND